MRVAVVGCGYVGLVSGVGLATVGHHVVGIEQDPARRARIAAGRAPFHEPGVPEALEKALDDGSFAVTGDLGEALDADIVLLCVQTPPRDDGAIDLSVLRQASSDLAALPLDDGERRRVLAVRSTVVPGTVETVVAGELFGDGRLFSDTLAVASNPEFLREGSALQDLLEADRVLVGCEAPWAREMLGELYGPFGAPIMTTPIATAELTKYASNALLATLVSFSNEIARLAEATPGVDVEDVFSVLHLDRRLRPTVNGEPVTPGILSYLRAGCGFGGSCLPKDVSALSAYGHSVDQPTPVLDAVLEVNRDQPVHLVELAEEATGGLEGRTVAVLGLAFKGGTDDLRASPGLLVVDELLRRGCDVVVHDPLVAAAALTAHTAQGVRVAATVDEALAGSVAALITTNAEEYRDLGHAVGPDGPVVVDGRRIVDPAGVPTRYSAIGLAPNAPNR
jgi:UDPglucose 6-dehydrogenase